MKKFLLRFSLLILAVCTCMACSDSGDPDNPANFPNNGQLQVKAALYSSETGSSFGSDEQIGLFISKNTTLDNEKADYTNVNCTSQGPDEFWKLSEVIQLTKENTTVFAYYPFKPNVNNLRKIPVDITEMEDICFGVNDQQSTLNREQPIALITMKHALVKVKFNLILDDKEDYAGPAIIQSARVIKLKSDASVDEDRFSVLTIEGLLDASTGRISTTTSGKLPIEMLVGKTFTYEGILEEEQPFFYSCPEVDMKDFAFAIVIDGKQHILRIEDGTEWRAATINTYTFRLQGQSLVFDGDENGGLDIKKWENIEKEIDY